MHPRYYWFGVACLPFGSFENVSFCGFGWSTECPLDDRQLHHSKIGSRFLFFLPGFSPLLISTYRREYDEIIVIFKDPRAHCALYCVGLIPSGVIVVYVRTYVRRLARECIQLS